MAEVINRGRINRYLDLNFNVLFIGLHGVGKTVVVKEEFTKRFGDRWRYFSASTLDPWVDFVGVPKPTERDGHEFIKMIRPEFVEYDQVEAIFLDEFNRAHDKVLNAVMELIQFKSINGHKLNNLKVIWAAINPEDDDDTYSVNHVDPAQLDRFHVHYQVPYAIDDGYFKKKFPNTGQIFITWWKGLPGDIQKMVSPRRVEYAAFAYENNCRLEDFLPSECNIKSLRDALGSLPFHDQLKCVTSQDQANGFIKDINNSTKLLDLVKMNDSTAIDFFVKYGSSMPKELVEPFVDLVYAKKNGLEVVKNLEELIDKLPNDKGNQGTAAIINATQLDLLYKTGGSLEADLRSIATAKRNMAMKLTNRCVDVLIGCRVQTVERILWGPSGTVGGTKTNFYKIIVILSKIGLFTAKQKQCINNKLYSNKIVEDMHFL